MQTVDLITAVVILVGLVGIVLPILPGLLLIAVAIIGWAAVVGEPLGWAAAGIGVLVLSTGAVVKYVVAGRHMRSHGVPNATLVIGGLAGIVGFFVLPVVGLPVGFVLGIYLAELQRLGRARAWPATKRALTAVGLALLIELVAGFTAAATWVAAAATT